MQRRGWCFRCQHYFSFWLGEQGWRSGESARLPPMCLGFDSRTRRHMWAEFVGSLLCSKRFFSRNSGFPLSTKTNIWFDLFDLQSPQLVQHSCSARIIWDSNNVVIIIIIIIIIIICSCWAIEILLLLLFNSLSLLFSNSHVTTYFLFTLLEKEHTCWINYQFKLSVWVSNKCVH